MLSVWRKAMKTVIILEGFPYIRQRMKDILCQEMNIYDSETGAGLFKIMNDLNNQVDLVILDINLVNEDGFATLAKLRETRPNIPIMIVTSLGTREDFARGIKYGAVDYLLKPFDDKTFKERVVNNLQKETRSTDPLHKQVYINFQDYLRGEIKKASKGNYKVSIVMTTILKKSEIYDNNAEKEYYNIFKKVFDSIRDILWVTDILVDYGPQSSIGVFPFCSEENVSKVLNKFNEKFKELQEHDESLKQFDLINAYVTYNIDGDTKDELLKQLFDKISDKISPKK